MHNMACEAVGFDGEIALSDLPIFSSLCTKCQLAVIKTQGLRVAS